MNGKLILSNNLNQRLLMNQKLKQVIQFLQYTTIEIKEQIQELLETNPLVEIKEEADEAIEQNDYDAKNYSLGIRNKSSSKGSDEDYLLNIASEKSLRDFLIDQTLNCHFNDMEQDLSVMLIDMIDDDGFINISDEEIYAEVNLQKKSSSTIECHVVDRVLKTIQTFEPFGIASRSIKDCLLSQIKVKNDGSAQYLYASKIVEMDALKMGTINFKELEKKSGLTHDELNQALNVIKMLDFHPAKSFSTQSNQTNDPEIYVKKIGTEWRAFLIDSILTKVEVNNHYKKIIKNHTRDKAYKTVLNQLQEASFILNGIKRRNDTLLRVANYIVETQQAFFTEGPVALKSVNLVDAANALEFHESTISRITTGKYIATPHGIYELKYFFPSHVSTEVGESKSSISVKVLIKEIIISETRDSSYSDEDISKLLKKRGINISRRTVTKYRESMDIPTSYLRHSVHEFNKS
jgi:RNA polymerase sigma-54 factor